MSLILLESLVAVAQHGSMGEAARALSISQPALTRRIQQLEVEFGAELVVRSGRGIAMTNAGRRAVSEAQGMIGRYRDLQAELAGGTGRVRVAAEATSANYLLPVAVERFLVEHRSAQCEVREVEREEAQRRAASGDCDLAIITALCLEPTLSSRPLATDHIVLVAGAQHPLRSRRGLSIADLQDQALIRGPEFDALEQLVDRTLVDAQIRVGTAMRLGSPRAVLHMVRSVGGLALVSELCAERRDRIELEGWRATRQLELVWREGTLQSQLAERFAAQLVRVADSLTSSSC